MGSVRKISEYQIPNDQKSLNLYAKQLGQLFFSKISYNFTIKLILKFMAFLNIFLWLNICKMQALSFTQSIFVLSLLFYFLPFCFLLFFFLLFSFLLFFLFSSIFTSLFLIFSFLLFSTLLLSFFFSSLIVYRLLFVFSLLLTFNRFWDEQWSTIFHWFVYISSL